MSHPAIAHARPAPKNRTRRLSKTASARVTLAEFGHGVELDVLTFGQFSIMDAVEALLDVTGPADVSISTWTAAAADLSRTARHLSDARIRSLRMVVDRSFLTRQPAYAARCVELFGVESLRTTRIHAKFVLIRNDSWRVVVRTSMNLNENPRLEYLQVVDDADLADWYEDVLDDIFAAEPAGLAGPRSTPALADMSSIIQPAPIAMGASPRTGP